jgi:enoyl-CoA hydratase
VPVLAMELARARLSKRALHHATLLARIYDPEGGLAAGYLDEVVPPEEVMGRARAEAARLAGLSRRAFHATKQRLRGATIERIVSSLDTDLAALLPEKA